MAFPFFLAILASLQNKLKILFFAQIISFKEKRNCIFLFVFSFLFFLSGNSQVKPRIINDITALNPVEVDSILIPLTTEEIANAVKNCKGPISIGGGKYSQGGQTMEEKSLHIDMRGFNKVLNFSKENKEITVQAGIIWRKVLEYIDTFDLSVRIMQTYANFTVGGSLSVNVHGRYVGEGPLILSVKQFNIILADGSLLRASRQENSELFYSAIGGYGGLGVITEVTLYLTDNCKVMRTDKMMKIKNYKNFFFEKIKSDSLAIFHNADIYPRRYKKVRAITYTKTNEKLTETNRLKPLGSKYRFHRFAFRVISGFPGGKWIRKSIFDPLVNLGNPVEWRNFEAGYEVKELEPKSRKKSTYVLQEYFVPVNEFDKFYPEMKKVFRKHHVNVMNVSIRYAKKDPGSLLAWAKQDVFAFVVYYKQGTREKDRGRVREWTKELVDVALSCKGSYYLPYQIHASAEQFAAAYPNAKKFFELKKKLDPQNKFRNKLWDAYYNVKEN
ncbi:MAG: FAD-binding oxidoreductase [Bacteroidia bacterium]|nr:FAD-binding oxidoreductase [Bacteroidia bacterium]